MDIKQSHTESDDAKSWLVHCTAQHIYIYIYGCILWWIMVENVMWKLKTVRMANTIDQYNNIHTRRIEKRSQDRDKDSRWSKTTIQTDRNREEGKGAKELKKRATNKQMNRDSYLISCDGNEFCFRK